jgi:hypothetical protein
VTGSHSRESGERRTGVENALERPGPRGVERRGDRLAFWIGSERRTGASRRPGFHPLAASSLGLPK